MSPSFFKRKVKCSVFPKFGELPLELQLQIWYFACLETPYNPDNEEGKLWQGFQAFAYDLVPQKRRTVHVLRPIATLPTWKRMKHFKRRHTANETGIIATNARQTHALLRTCRQSRLALMEQYSLTSAWNTVVNFDADIFFFDVRWTGFPLSQHVCTRPVPQHLMLQYPEEMARIKNLAIVNQFLGTRVSMVTFTGEEFNTFLGYDRLVKPLLKSVEKIFIIGHTIHCDNVLSIEETGCAAWELGELRYMEEPIPLHTLQNPPLLPSKAAHWNQLPAVLDEHGNERPNPVFVDCLEVVCLHKERQKRCRDLRVRFIPRFELVKALRNGARYAPTYTKAIRDTIRECRQYWSLDTHF